ncbi:sialic acid-binding Ig-like lectin 5 [Epinephelus fuscoguttatus]|uniref:sialic acid-binding Ig-like lectin 5 n=1 Tax=Epinephelus fuscoguttatus TaxID=293821 RepID=UPI0020D08EF6|nr:sialic acid-binding Ig-like lectin 5 [Epinephelus fuscoguttatus]
MTLIYSVILCLFFKARICQLQCVKETLDDTEFSINVTTHIEVEAGDCIWIPYEFTFPTNKVTAPYRKIWFKGDPQNTISAEVVDTVESETKDTSILDGLPRGEYEFGFKLEWECNQTYIFPKRVQISVSATTHTADVTVPSMEEGRAATLRCDAFPLCTVKANIHWKWTKAGGQLGLESDDDGYNYDYGERYLFSILFGARLTLTPTADHHNTNITCVADYGHSVVETTVTLDVKFSPKILNSSQCMVEGKLLVCVCISRGNPLAPITWPSLTDFTVTSSSSIQTVNSIITMSAADYHDTSVKCISSNELGRAQVEIPLQNYTENRLNYELDSNHSSNAVLPWIITGVSLSLNLILLTSLIICIKRCRGKSQQRELDEDMNTYASLNQPDVGQEYSVISPRTRGVSRKGPGVARDTP